jgi:HK97 family phage major capsid protein
MDKATVEELTNTLAEIKDIGTENKNDIESMRLEMTRLRKAALARAGTPAGPSRKGGVSEDCARHIGARIFLQAESLGALEKAGMDAARRDSILGVCRDALGVQSKTALTTSDIPLPIEYSGEVVVLVSLFGTARMYGTVYPLGTGTVKLPKLTTDTAFALIAMSGSGGEKSPAVGFVTFTAEKFGGLVRVPSEIDADSIVAMGQFLARYCARQIASIEDVNFWTSTGAGSGVNGSVEGFTKNTITNSKVSAMASTKTHYSDATLANLRTLRTVPDAAALRTSAYYMHPSFEQLLASLNTAGDKPYNPQAQIQGNNANPFRTGPTLDGFPIRWIDTLPAYSTGVNASKVFILFGDPSYQYLGVRPGLGMEISKEVFFATDELAVRCLERFTIGLMATGAVGGLQTAAS